MHQPSLTESAAQGKGTDQFAQAREARPGDRLILFYIPGTSFTRMVAVPPSSRWHDLLPAEQTVKISLEP